MESRRTDPSCDISLLERTRCRSLVLTRRVETTLASRNLCFSRSPSTGRPLALSIVLCLLKLRRELLDRGLDRVSVSEPEFHEFWRGSVIAGGSATGDVPGEGTRLDEGSRLGEEVGRRLGEDDDDVEGEDDSKGDERESGDAVNRESLLTLDRGSSYMAISSIASSSELPGSSSPLMSSSESRRDEESFCALWTGKS